MRDTSAAAHAAEDRDTVLPYDPDDWDRRLAEARTRRAAVLRRRAAAQDAQDAAPRVDRPGHVAAVAAPQRSAERAAPTRLDPEDWRRRLAEARGLAGPGGAASAAQARPAAPDTRPEPAAMSPAAPATPVAAAPAAVPVQDVPSRRSAWTLAMLVGIVGFGGLAGGVALTLALIGPGARTDGIAAVPAGVAAAAPGVAGLGQRPATAPRPAPLPTVPDPVLPRTTPSLVPVPVLPTVPPVPPANRIVAGPPAPLDGTEAAAPAGLDQPPAMVPSPIAPRAGADPVAARTVPVRPPVVAPPSPAGALVAPARNVAPAPTPSPDGGAPADAADPFVVLHRPSATAPGTVQALAESRAAGWPVVTVDFTVSRSHLRVYHDADRAAAAVLGARLGLPVRDFMGVVPAPDGLIEVWLAGGPGEAG